MEKFLNKLIESVIIINSDGEIVFVNGAFIKSLEYECGEITLEEIKKGVSFQGDKIFFTYGKDIAKKGVYENAPIQWEGYDASSVIIKWKNEIEYKEKVDIYEKLLDEMEPWIVVKNKQGKFVYVNKQCLEFHNTTREKTIEILNEKLSKSKYSGFEVQKDEDVLNNKVRCFYEVEKYNGNVKEYYKVKKYPLIYDEDVKYIGVVVKNVSIQKHIQYKILDNLNLIQGIDENGKLKMNKVDEAIFESFKTIFEQLLSAKYFNIWIYNEEKKVITPVFTDEVFDELRSNNKSISITENQIKKLLNSDYERVVKVNSGYDKENKALYVSRYPLIIHGKFKGIMTMRYEECHKEIMDNGFIKTLCSEISFIISYIELSKGIHRELKHRNEIESEMNAFLNTSTDIMLKINGLKIKEVSESCFHVLGWTKEQVLRMNIEDLIHHDDIEKTVNLLKKQAESDEKLVWENRVRCVDGTYKWLRWSNNNYMESRGHIYSSGKDITIEKELELRNKEIERAKQLDEFKNEFFANISHEFKTPINLIMTSSQLMSQQIDNYRINKAEMSSIRKHINIYRQNSYRLLRLVNNLIDITKIDSGFYNIEPINVNIISIVEEIVLSVVEYCKGNEIELIFDTEVEEEIIACDPDQVERIMLNLLSNAIKYTAEKGKITIEIYLEDQYVVTSVKDTGMGISKERLDIIFDRFGRGEDTLTKTCEGSGIGLSLVKALVELHGGKVEVLSEVGVGSTFEIRFPRKQLDMAVELVESQEIKQSKIEKCSIEFSDIYNL